MLLLLLVLLLLPLCGMADVVVTESTLITSGAPSLSKKNARLLLHGRHRWMRRIVHTTCCVAIRQERTVVKPFVLVGVMGKQKLTIYALKTNNKKN